MTPPNQNHVDALGSWRWYGHRRNTAVPMGPVECVRSNFLEIAQTTCIPSRPTFATGCHFFAGQFGKLIECSPNLFAKFTGRRREEQGREWAERGTEEEKRYRYPPHAIPIQYQYQYTIPVSDRITRGRNAIFGHVARLADNIPAHQAMLRQVELSVGRPPDPTWKRPPGRPRTKWTDQLCRDNNNVPIATLCGGNYWSRSLESDATVPADYALTTMSYRLW